VLTKLLHNAGLVRDFHGSYENEAPELVQKAENTWGLHPLGYQYAQHSAGTNWYLPEASAFINIYTASRNSGSITVMMDDEENPNQNLFFRLLDGTVVARRQISSDIPGCPIAYMEYSNKTMFLEALRKADLLVRDNASNQAIYALALLNTTPGRSRCP
jgi:hypothetical protein